MRGERISIVIPFHNEEGSIDTVLGELRQLLPAAEVIAVNDGSSDLTEKKISIYPEVKLISFKQNKGQSAAIYEGLLRASRDHIVLMDGDGQHDPKDIPVLLGHLENADFVCGFRRNRKDSFIRILASKIANSIRRLVLKDSAADTGSIKVIRKEHISRLVYFDGLHRYIPTFLANANLRMAEVPVSHRPRRNGRTHYSISRRGLKGIADIIRVRAMLKNKRSSDTMRA
jgi:dolichol-phosphate mannosyltransferase